MPKERGPLALVGVQCGTSWRERWITLAEVSKFVAEGWTVYLSDEEFPIRGRDPGDEQPDDEG